MGQLSKDIFICLDCETTGLEHAEDKIIEIAVCKFTLDGIIESFETLIDPESPITEESMKFHHITDDMVQGKPKIAQVLPKILSMVQREVIVGHAIINDLKFLQYAADRAQIPANFLSKVNIDTLRLARLYGESPTNSLETLRKHFNIADEGAHRAMSDVLVNIEVFRYLSKNFKTTEQILERLQKPVPLKVMPLGKHKGRPFNEIPTEYLAWAVHKDFDQDLMFSLKTELKKRKQGNQFGQASNPFSSLG